MANAKVDRAVTVTLELTDDEAKGLYTLLNWGIHYSTATRLNVVSIAHALNKEYDDSSRDPSFLQKATLS